MEGFTPIRAVPGGEALAVTKLKHLSPQTLPDHYFETGCLLLDQLSSRIGPERALRLVRAEPLCAFLV
jgi:hypothetical protein